MIAVVANNDEYEVAQGILPIPHVPRKAQTFPGADYLLPADEKERQRLLLQHDMLTKGFGDQLVLAPLNLDEVQFVLDSGTGAGIWITEIAKKVPPSVILHGIDIETSLVPLTLPPNISIFMNSVTNLPTEWTGRFDLVHQRLLTAALRKSEWAVALSELYRVLRPGGWIQLLEPSDFLLGKPSLTGCQSKLVKLLQQVYIHRDLLVNCASQIPQLLTQTGFVNVKVERQYFPLGSCSGEIGSIHKESLGGVFRGVKTPVLRAGGLGLVDSEEAFDTLLDDVEREWDDIEGSGNAYYTIIAQKPDTVPAKF